MIKTMVRKHSKKPSYKETHSVNSLSYSYISFCGQVEMQENEEGDLGVYYE